jgi:hypothetical protein
VEDHGRLAIAGLDVDVGSEELRYGAEYFGEAFHGSDEEDHDNARLEWLDQREDWVIDVFRRHNVYGPRQDVDATLRAGVARARRRFGLSAWANLERRPGAACPP